MEAVVKYPNLCKELATLRIRFGSSVRNQEEPRIKEFYDAIQEGFKLLKIIIPKMIDVLPYVE
jgi:hypothetical protein